MGNRLYVGNLPFSTTAEDLQSHFAQAGTVVSAELVSDKFTGRSRGFAFVEMSNQDEANKAIAEFHGKDFQGRTLTVNEARPREERPPRGDRDFGGGGGGYGGGRRDRDRDHRGGGHRGGGHRGGGDYR
jgi:RNA recognition motif-containing protein